MELDRARLLEPADLQALTTAGTDADLLIVDVGTAARFAQAHLPGASLVTPPELVSGIPPASGRLPDDQGLATLAQRLALTPETLVVAYDDEGGGWAGRLLWTLEVLGHSNWKYLDGGIHAWHAEGLPLTEVPSDRAKGETLPQLQLDLSPVAEANDVEATIAGPGQIWDARSFEEYSGSSVHAARGGHVPGARHLDWLDLLDRDRALRLREDVADVISSAGLDLEAPIITHCQSHHRSGLTWLVGRLLGLDIRAYHGSWSEWGNDPTRTVRTGAEP